MQTLRTLASRISGPSEDPPCGCVSSVEGDALRVDASDCDGSGRLETEPSCRETVVRALESTDVDRVQTETAGWVRTYDHGAAALLVAAGRFAERCRPHDERLADLACRDPLAAAREATGRPDVVADIAATSGLAALASRSSGIEATLSPVTGLRISDWRVDTATPPGASLAATRPLDTGGTVRQYERSDDRDRYVLDPLENDIDDDGASLLSEAFDRLAAGEVTGQDRAPARALRAAGGGHSGDLDRILHKHTRGYGLLEDLFADPAVSDVFVSAPVAENPVRVKCHGRMLLTNVRLTNGGVRALASAFRHESGQGFSAADPTLDAGVHISDRNVRVAGVTDPVSDGTAFAFRAHDDQAWTVPALVANGTLTAAAAALLSVAAERGRSILLAGPRGAGKTTLLSALLWELPPTVRTVVIEDAPELPVGRLQEHDRDVQGLRADDETGLSPEEALRTALRMGDGALVVGEVRGPEASVLYEAMRVGANSEAVLGTIHGEGAAGVYDRVVSDLGVDPSAFGATDLVVTLETADSTDQSRRVATVEEVVDPTTGAFEALFDRPEGSLSPTGRIDRGKSTTVAALARPSETYADVRAILERREEWFEQRCSAGALSPDQVMDAWEERA